MAPSPSTRPNRPKGAGLACGEPNSHAQIFKSQQSCLHSQLRVVCRPMGSKSRNRPQKLARKLLQIRNTLGLSQSQLLRRLGAADSFTPARISEYESGTREPSL